MGVAAELAIIEVEFDGYGRVGHQAAAAAVLHEAGLTKALGDRVRGRRAVELPEPSPARGERTGLINEPALLELADQLRELVSAERRAGRFPMLVGGDCSILLGVLPACRREAPTTGLLLVDGHEDTMPLDVVEDGEAANTEIALLLGITGRTLDVPLAEHLPALEPERLAILGTRDQDWRRQFNVASVAGLGAHVRTAEDLDDPAQVGRTAAEWLSAGGPWWLHVDLDVLDPDELPATLVPGEVGVPGGLSWDQLTTLLTAATAVPGCVGLSVVIYDPELDPGHEHAGRIVRLIVDTVRALDRAAPG